MKTIEVFHIAIDWDMVRVRDDACVVVLTRKRLQDLENTLAGLRLGLLESDVDVDGEG